LLRFEIVYMYKGVVPFKLQLRLICQEELESFHSCWHNGMKTWKDKDLSH